MPDFSLYNQTGSEFVTIPARFIDMYMIPAAGEYVKVYLCLLRCAVSGTSCSVGRLAEILRHTEGDILRALHYWETQNLISLRFDARNELTALTLLPLSASAGASEAPAESEDTAPVPVSDTVIPDPDPSPDAGLSGQELVDLGNDEAFQEFLLVAQQYLGRTLRPSDCDRFGYWYRLFNQNADLLEYLVEYCADNGHTSLHYMEKVALNWHQGGVSSRASAREYTDSRNSAVHAAMSAFGLKDRAPGSPEQDLIRKWQNTYGFSPDMIRLACSRTISAIHKPSFEYADKILSSWKDQGLDSPEAVSASDARRRKKSPDTAKSHSTQNRFHNFGQRQYDYSALEDQIYGYHNQKED